MGKFQNHDEHGIAYSSSYGNTNLGGDQHVEAPGAPNEIAPVLRPDVVDFLRSYFSSRPAKRESSAMRRACGNCRHY